jgi:hypothetical protein
MVSKKERRKWRKYLQEQAGFQDLKLRDLIIRELEYEGRMRRKALRMARKRKTTDYIT